MSAPRCPCSPDRAATWVLHRHGRGDRARSRGRDQDQFSDWGGALATAGDVVFYGTLKAICEAVDAKTGKELYKFKTRPASSAT